MTTAAPKAIRHRTRLQATFLALVLCPLFSRAAAPLPAFPNPPDLATNVPGNANLAWSPGEVDLISNGGFESGNTGGWTQEQIGAGTILMNQDTTAEGNFSVLIYAVNFPRGQYGLHQNVTLPPNATQLVLRWSALVQNLAPDFSNTPNSLQGYRVELRNLDNTLRQVLYTTRPGDPTLQDWTKQSVDLSSFRGQTVRVAFIAYGTIEFMILLLDRISLVADAPGGVSSEVFLDTNPSVGGEDLIGTTTNSSWELPALQPSTTYYWRILTRFEGAVSTGPIWRFTTAPRGSIDHFAWSHVLSPQQPGDPITVTLKAKDKFDFTATGFSGPATLRAQALQFGAEAHFLLPEEPFTAFTSYKNGTVGYAFTPSTNLWVRALRAHSGDQISLWTDGGVLLAREQNPSGTVSWTDLPLPHPLPLLASRRYRIGVYSKSIRPVHARFDGAGTFAHGTLDQAYVGIGNGWPNTPHPARWWFVDLVYQTAAANPIALTPNMASNFVNGTWSGTLALSAAATNVVLLAQTGDGQMGYANLFDLRTAMDTDGDGMPDDWEIMNGLNPDDPADAAQDPDGDGQTNLQEYRAGTDPGQAASLFHIGSIRVEQNDAILTFPSVLGKRYHVQRAPVIPSANWADIAVDLEGTGNALEVRDPGAAQAGNAFYRIFIPPTP